MVPHNWLTKLAYRFGLQGVVTVQNHAIVLPANRAAVPPLRIAFASDFHAGSFTHPRLLSAACQALSEARPDLLLLGGDFVTHKVGDMGDLAAQLGRIPAPLGRFAVLGNHDHWANTRRIIRQLQAGGVQVLVNRNVELPAPYAQVWVCGLDDSSTGFPNARKALWGAIGTRIVLMHSPDGLLAVKRFDFDLALCGHTHGGQVALPNGKPLLLPQGKLCRRFIGGRYNVGVDRGSPLIVTHGIGCTTVPIRLFAASDIVICHCTFQ